MDDGSWPRACKATLFDVVRLFALLAIDEARGVTHVSVDMAIKHRKQAQFEQQGPRDT